MERRYKPIAIFFGSVVLNLSVPIRSTSPQKHEYTLRQGIKNNAKRMRSDFAGYVWPTLYNLDEGYLQRVKLFELWA